MVAMTDTKPIEFSPPDITQKEIDEVVGVLKSGWITTGPKTKELEKRLTEFCESAGTACLSSATAALECALRLLEIGEGDEVITSAYTYTATAAAICHTGATLVLVDTMPGSYEINYDRICFAITEKTKAIIPVDIAGKMCDYKRLFSIVEGTKNKWNPDKSKKIQASFQRIPIIADAAHSLGADYQGQKSGSVADFSAFSFHAVKNFTTAEGGALTWKNCSVSNEEIYTNLMQLSLHGQTKDALAKANGGWEYDISFPGYKCNMTDIQAALGLAQLERYPGLLARRKEIALLYEEELQKSGIYIEVFKHFDTNRNSSAHLMLVRMPTKNEESRNAIIDYMAKHGVATNVHYKPLPLLSAYKNLGFDISDYQCAYKQYEHEITLPLHTLMSDEDVIRVVSNLKDAYASC